MLLDGAIAFVDVISARSVVDLQTNNLKRLEKQLEATKERFKVGEVTRTDVAQAEARVDRAKADKIKATGDLTSLTQRIIESWKASWRIRSARRSEKICQVK